MKLYLFSFTQYCFIEVRGFIIFCHLFKKLMTTQYQIIKKTCQRLSSPFYCPHSFRRRLNRFQCKKKEKKVFVASWHSRQFNHTNKLIDCLISIIDRVFIATPCKNNNKLFCVDASYRINRLTSNQTIFSQDYPLRRIYSTFLY